MNNLTNSPNQSFQKPIIPPPISEMSDSELKDCIKRTANTLRLRISLLEYFDRQDKHIASLTNRIEALEKKTNKKSGRKRQVFTYNGRELTDDEIIYYVDNDYLSISKLEKEVGAGKNQLRNRYNKAKKQKERERRDLYHGSDEKWSGDIESQR